MRHKWINYDWKRFYDWGLNDRRFNVDSGIYWNKLFITSIFFLIAWTFSVDFELTITNANDVSVYGSVEIKHIDNCDAFILQEFKIFINDIRETLIVEGMVEDCIILILSNAAT